MDQALRIARRVITATQDIIPRRLGVQRAHRLLTRWLTPKEEVTVRSWDILFKLDVRDHVECAIFWQYYEPKTIALWGAYCSPHSVVVDIGANVGLFSLLAARRGARVFAFEPQPITYQRLQRNIALNSDWNPPIITSHYAISDRRGTATIFDDIKRHEPWHNSGVASLSSKNAGGEGTLIETITLDSYAALQQLGRLDCIKMDIQGAELLALRGAKETLKRLSPHVIMEFDATAASGFGWSKVDLRTFADELGYKIEVVEGDNLLLHI